MITFIVNNERIYPVSVWYHHQNDIKSECLPYEIKIVKDYNFIKILEKKFEIDSRNKKFFSKTLSEAYESHFSLVSIITQYLIKNKGFKRVNIEWVFNSVEKVIYTGEELIVFGKASKYSPRSR